MNAGGLSAARRRGGCSGASLGTVLFLAVWLWPRSSVDKLYVRAKPLMESTNPDEDWAKALDPERDGSLYQFEHYHADDKGEHADEMRRWAALAHQRECYQMVRNSIRNKKKGLPYEAHGEWQENAFAAGQAEEEGDLKAATEDWTKVKESGAKGGWVGLAEDRLQQLAAVESEKKTLEQHLVDLRELDYKPAARCSRSWNWLTRRGFEQLRRSVASLSGLRRTEQEISQESGQQPAGPVVSVGKAEGEGVGAAARSDGRQRRTSQEDRQTAAGRG